MQTMVGEANFLILFVTKEENTQILMSLGSFLLTRLDIESSLIWIDEVDKLFDMVYILIENHVKFVAYRLNEIATVW